MLTRRKAFTIIEIMMVVAVIAILIGLVVWGLKGAGDSASGNTTRTTLQNLTNMSEELNRKNQLAGFDLIYPPAGALLPIGPEYAPMAMLTDHDGVSQRFGDAVRRTADVMRRLTSLPDNKRILEKFPSDQVLAVPAGNFSNGNPSNGGNVVLDAWHNPILFVPGAGLKFVGSKQTNPTYVSGNTYSAGARVIERSTLFTSTLVYWTANVSTNKPPSEPDWFEGIRAPDGRPFWVSGGPDGAIGTTPGPDMLPGDAFTNSKDAVDNLGAGDDNIYSFEH